MIEAIKTTTPQQTINFNLNYLLKPDRKILKVFLLERLHKIFLKTFKDKILSNQNSIMECYAMDNKIIQLIITAIIETEEYTLEGIANYTRIPFDVIFDAARGEGNQLSITLWTRIIDLFIQVKPDIAKSICKDLLETIANKEVRLSLLLK